MERKKSESVYFGSKIQASQKRLVGVAINLNGKVDNRVLWSMRKKAGKLSGYSQTLTFSDENGEAVFIFEVYSAESTCFIKRIYYRLRKLLTAAARYIGITDHSVRISLNGTDMCPLPMDGAN